MSASSLLVGKYVNPVFLWQSGTRSLDAGIGDVSLNLISADDNVVLTRTSAASASGLQYTIIPGVGFRIISSSNTDFGTIQWTWFKAHA
jgi:hypothetical protein